VEHETPFYLSKLRPYVLGRKTRLSPKMSEMRQFQGERRQTGALLKKQKKITGTTL
jgi:hypothetical protein